jgi:arylsulfatase A-like enzyme
MYSSYSSTRRSFLKGGLALTGGMLAGRLATAAQTVAAKKPNFLFILLDQLSHDALSAYGNPYVSTPNMDRLINRGYSFMQSYSTNPICSPARSSLFTGRMPVETGVVSNNRPIHSSCVNMGQWFSDNGYETVYSGKWHLPLGQPTAIEGFSVLPHGSGQGDLTDAEVSRNCEAYLKNRSGDNPFLLVTSILQPHDICFWPVKAKGLNPEKLPLSHIEDQLPPLHPNHTSRPKSCELMNERIYRGWNESQWRYYSYIYYRQVEMADADIGRVLDALEDSGQAENTIVILTADHGESLGRHMNVGKWHTYDESVKVPFVISWPGRIAENKTDTSHLVSGLDVMSTLCDYADISEPPHSRGRSLKPLLEGNKTDWREFVVSEHHIIGRMVRSNDFKYVKYHGDDVEQLFDMKADPGETVNLYDNSKYGDIVKDHRRMLDEWNAHLLPVKPTECIGGIEPYLKKFVKDTPFEV